MTTDPPTSRRGRRSWRAAFAGVVALLSIAAGPACAEFPDRPIKIVVPFAPAGGTDTVARLLARRLEPVLHQSIVVENLPGAAGTIGSANVARAPADGYTLLLGISGTMAIAPSMYPKLAYDPVRDFVPVGEVGVLGNVLVVHPSVPVHDVKELVAWSRKQPDGGSYSSWGIGSGGHLAMEMIKAETGIRIAHIPYKGAILALNDTIANQVPVAMTDVTSVAPFYKSGRVRVIAVTGSKRAPTMPDVPTLKEQGIPFDTDSWYALFVPAKTPKPVVDTLRAALATVLAEPDVAKSLADIGLGPATLSPDAFAAEQKKDIGVWAKLVKLSGAANQD